MLWSDAHIGGSSMYNQSVFEDVDAIASATLPWEELHGSTVLVTGASGFIASYIVEVLLRLNDKFDAEIKVVALVRNVNKAHAQFSHHLNRGDLALLVQDVCDPVVSPLCGGVDFIIHAASQASPSYYGTDPVGTALPNVVGTVNLLKLAAKEKTKALLFVSSSEVYGEVPCESLPVKESNCGSVNFTQVRSCYAESKRMGEVACISWMHQFGVPVKIVRPFHTYGPGVSLDDGRVFADFTSDILHNRDIVMKSDGLSSRAFCYVSDVVLGIFMVLLSGAPGEAYNIGHSAETRIIDLATTLAGLFPEKNLGVVKHDAPGGGYIPSKVARSVPDISKMKGLGWNPTVSLEDGFRRMITSYMQNASK